MKQSLSNYLLSVGESKRAIEEFIAKYDIQEARYPRLSSHLGESLRQLTLKNDSLLEANAMVATLLNHNKQLLAQAGSIGQGIQQQHLRERQHHFGPPRSRIFPKRHL